MGYPYTHRNPQGQRDNSLPFPHLLGALRLLIPGGKFVAGMTTFPAREQHDATVHGGDNLVEALVLIRYCR